MRIVGGIWGGRRLAAPKGTKTRPTADRTKEALFSALFDVEDLEVLDLFAGSGALGLEALSRGARRATLVESDRSALRAIETNVDALDADAEVVPLDVTVAIARFAKDERRFDLVLADPPYDLDVDAVVASLVPILADGARVVFEHRHSDPPPEAPSGLTLGRTKRYGEAALAFYDKGE